MTVGKGCHFYFSLEAEQDSCGGPRRQETIGDTIAQTRFENVSKHSNDPLLARGNTLQSGKDSLKLNELMELCTNLQTRVLDLEKTKTIQAEEIVSLKRRVKKLEQKKRSRTHGLKRLYMWGRINDIDVDEDITLVNDQDDVDMFDVNTLTGDRKIKSILMNKKLSDYKLSLMKRRDLQGREKMKPCSYWLLKNGMILGYRSDAELQLAQRLQAEEQEQFITKQKVALFKELLEQRKKHFAAKKAEENRNKPPTKAQQKKTMITYLKNMEGWKHKDLKSKYFDSIKELFDKAFKRVNMFVDYRTDLVEGSSKRAGDELEQEVTKK
ncbi:hypothetical protein Tco_0843199 [Tanacetum coccineum]|uniref:Uncharacterized protein n=1 Tax=Tanacetum coccineum TaxID=301880 RepID=A0ABQ5B478_9ASTR